MQYVNTVLDTYVLVCSYYRHVLMKIEIKSATISFSKNKTEYVFNHKFN